MRTGTPSTCRRVRAAVTEGREFPIGLRRRFEIRERPSERGLATDYPMGQRLTINVPRGVQAN